MKSVLIEMQLDTAGLILDVVIKGQNFLPFFFEAGKGVLPLYSLDH